jgi:hypothetical protein
MVALDNKCRSTEKDKYAHVHININLEMSYTPQGYYASTVLCQHMQKGYVLRKSQSTSKSFSISK